MSFIIQTYLKERTSPQIFLASEKLTLQIHFHTNHVLIVDDRVGGVARANPNLGFGQPNFKIPLRHLFKRPSLKTGAELIPIPNNWDSIQNQFFGQRIAKESILYCIKNSESILNPTFWGMTHPYLKHHFTAETRNVLNSEREREMDGEIPPLPLD